MKQTIMQFFSAPTATGLGGATRRAATMLLVTMLTTVTAWATTTSTINVGGTDYTLFTGFTATGGTEVNSTFVYGNMVDGITSTSFHAFTSPAYVEFNSDDPIIPKGYIFNTYDASSFKPTSWVLKAKADSGDDWTELDNLSGQSISGQEHSHSCNNEGNNAYKYFRFEVSNNNNNIWLTEIRLYGYESFTYTHLTARAATCTEVGIKQECYLRNDGKYFSDANGTTELNASDVEIPMIAHNGVHHDASANNIEYWQCSMCNKYFSDSGCTNEITEEQTKVVKYLATDGTLTTLNENTTTVTSTTTSWSNGWYVVYDDVTVADRISVSGTVNLILCNNATLTASKGITVGSSATFNVYAQSEDEATMGSLTATAENNSNNSAIGGVYQTNFGTININGGKITATTNYNCGAPIGGAYGSNSGNITINGGIVSATAHDYTNCAGIGGGNNGYVSSIILNGGVITATGDTQYGGAGIGTGTFGGSGTMTITITSGVKRIVATKGNNSDCIGKESNATTTVNVVFKHNNSEVTGDAKNAVFYDTGESASSRTIRGNVTNHSITISDDIRASVTASVAAAPEGETITLTLGTAVDASTLKVNAGSSDLTLNDIGDRKYTFVMPDANVTVTASVASTYSVTLPENMEIVNATNTSDANGKYISGTTVTFKVSFPFTATSEVSDGTNTLTATDGIYSVTVGTADITITATTQRSATIDLSDAPGDFIAIDNDVLTGSTSHTVTIANNAGITLSGATISGGIVCAGTADITLVGTNSVTGKQYKAGVQVGSFGTTLTIKGAGSLTATGGKGGAGIGTSVVFANESNTSGNIIIQGSSVTANGAEFDSNNHQGGDGIGKGYTYANATNTIGTVTVTTGIDCVEASSISETVVYMNGETDVTANSSDYFTIAEDGSKRTITLREYAITYNLNEGTNATSNPATYTVNTETFTLADPSREGYEFAGWFSDAELNTAATTTITKGTTGDKTFWAKWKKLMTNTDITVSIPSQEWTGSEVTPVITVKDGETTLTLTTDYTVTAPSGTIQDAGDYTYTITGAGNYSGETTATFTISAKAIGTYGAIAVTEDQSGKTATIDASSEAAIEITSNIEVKHVDFNRSFTANQPATVLLPFSLTGGQTVSGGSFYKFSGVVKDGDVWKAQFTEAATLKANTPYLFNPSANGNMTFDLNNGTVTLNTTTAGESGNTTTNWEFHGTYQKVMWNGSTGGNTDPSDLDKTYGFAKGNGTTIAAGQFVHFAAGAWLKPMRCYLVYNGSTEGGTFQNARRMTRGASASEELPQTIIVVLLSSNGGTTNIGTINTQTGEISFDGWYTIDGRKLDGKPTKKGLYINNGRKVVIK